jgi:ADP-heptose:LPS heptosyltransferase
LLVLFGLADVLVANDSGPAHFAMLTPVRVVTLFGPETPALYSARSPDNVPLWAGMICSPGVNAFNNRQSCCKNNVCMRSISVEQVFAAVVAALEGRGGLSEGNTRGLSVIQPTDHPVYNGRGTGIRERSFMV